MTLHIVDVSRHQVERHNPLQPKAAFDAGFTVLNIALDRGRQEDILPDWAIGYAAQARALGMGISCYRWLDARLPGDVSARRAYERMHRLGGPAGMAHAVDVEADADEHTIRTYVTTMTELLGRPIVLYSADWWWTKPGRNWHMADLTPYLWAAPNISYLPDYPGDTAPEWEAGYGGWTHLSVMQYAIKPLPGTGDCSLSAIRDQAVWDALTGGAMPISPDKHITAEHARFINEVEKLEPGDTGGLYPYVRQAGYHGSRNDQIALGLTNDYSIRLADDKAGPADKTAAFDWISEAARLRGDYTYMNKYGRRIRDAYNNRDTRLAGWREWLTYIDGILIGFDFVGWYTRTPGSSHKMHHHLSKLRRYTTHWPSYAAMLSLLAGEPLSIWQAGRSRYQEGNEMFVDDPHAMALAWRTAALTAGTDKVTGGPLVGEEVWLVKEIKRLGAALAASAVREQAAIDAISQLATAITAGGGSVDAAAIIAKIEERAADVTGRIAHLEAELDAERAALAEALASVDDVVEPGKE